MGIYKREREGRLKADTVKQKAWMGIFAPHPMKVQAGQSPACPSWSD